MTSVYSVCTLCPRRCGANRTRATGFCGESDKLRVARAALHFWEEPCLSGKTGSGAVFFSGCGLRCIYCQNAGIAHEHHGKEITAGRLSEIFLELAEKGAANINLVTPTHFVPHIREAIHSARKKGLTLPIVYNSSGYETEETLALLSGNIDIYLPDFKYLSQNLASELSHASDYPEIAKKALSAMVRQCGRADFTPAGLLTRGVLVRHLVLPGHIDDSMRILEYLHGTYGDDILISIMSQYTPLSTPPDKHPELRRKLTRYEYEKVLDYADRIGIVNGYQQYGGSASESFIPDFDYTGV